MAEEKQEAKKPIVEISVWFIICLIILIISTLLVIKLNGEKAALNLQLNGDGTAENPGYIALYNRALERENVLNEALKSVKTVQDSVNADPGQYSPAQITEMLNEALQQAGISGQATLDEGNNVVIVPEDVNSGEVNE